MVAHARREILPVMERIAYDACPLCGHEDASEIGEWTCTAHPLYRRGLPPSMRWLACDGCQHVFVDGYFDDRALAFLFEKTQRSQSPGILTDRAELLAARAVAATMVSDVIRAGARTDGRWLDVGFGSGALLTTADEFGFETVGLDLRQDSVARMRAVGFDARMLDLTAFETDKRFDVISMADVLEHMPFPARALERARALTTDGGLLFLSMPNLDAFAFRALHARGQNPYWTELEHLHNFGRRRLYALLREHGFEPCHYGVSARYVACMEVIARRV